MRLRKKTKNPTFTRFAKYHTPYMSAILLAMFCALVIALCELVALQILFKDTIDALEVVSASTFEEPVRVRYFQREVGLLAFDGFEISLLNPSDALKVFLWLLGGMLVLIFIKGVFAYCNDYIMARVGHKLAFRLRNTLYERIVSAPLGVLRQEHTGDLMTRLTDDVRVWQTLVAALANIIHAVVLVTLFSLCPAHHRFQIYTLCLVDPPACRLSDYIYRGSGSAPQVQKSSNGVLIFIRILKRCFSGSRLSKVLHLSR